MDEALCPIGRRFRMKRRLYLRQGGFPRRGTAPLGAVIDKMGGRFHPVKPGSPLVRQPRRRKKQVISLYIPANVRAQAKEKAYLLQVRTFNLGERTCRRRACPYATETLRPKASSSFARGGSPLSPGTARLRGLPAYILNIPLRVSARSVFSHGAPSGPRSSRPMCPYAARGP